MKKSIYYLSLFLLTSSLSLAQNTPKDFVELTTNVSSRGEYDQIYSLISETYYDYNTDNNLFTKSEEILFKYYDAKCTAMSGRGIETYEFYNNKISKYLNDSYNLESIYSYDTDDKLIQSTLVQPTSTNNTMISTYNGSQIIEQELYDKDNLLVQDFKFKYNSDGTLSNRMYFYSTYSERTEESYTYLDNNLIKIYKENYEEDIISSTGQELYEYYSNNKLKSKISNNTYGDSKVVYEYDSFGNIKVEIRYELVDNTWVTSRKEDYKYNYIVSLIEINLPGSINYTTKAFSGFELSPAKYKYIIPKYENGEIINFVEQVNIYNWNSNSKTWNQSYKVEYELSGGSLSNEVRDDENIESNIFMIKNNQIIVLDNNSTIDIYTLLGKKVINKNLKSDVIYIITITGEEGEKTTSKIMIK